MVAGRLSRWPIKTAAVTEEISREITSMQTVSGEVVESTQTIMAASNTMAEYINSIVSAIEEQTAVTGDISHT